MFWKSLLRKKPLEALIHNKSNSIHLKKTLGAMDLIFLGVGAIVGTGIFILPGTIAALYSGPAIVLSFVIAAVVCALAALCYSEFASSVPVAGSAYTYGYVIFGEFIAWLLGWALLLEYGLAVASVASGWSSYFKTLLSGFNLHIPDAISGAFNPAAGTYVNIPAIAIVAIIAYLLTRGIRESTRVNAFMVILKISVILLFILVGVFYVKPDNWEPFMPFGFSGVLNGAALVFFAYLGFDAVSSAAEEVKNPQKNMPIGIIGSLLVCTVLYIAVSIVLTGIVSYQDLNVADPVAFALQVINQNWIAGIVSLGAVVGMITVILVMLYGGTRLIYAMGRDGLLPKSMAEIDAKTNTPIKSTWTYAIVIMFFAGFVPLNRLAELVNMGTLFAFMMVSIGIIFLRRNKSIATGGFKTPLYPVLPIVSFLMCLFLITRLSVETWIACGVWFLLGLVLYFTFGRRNSTLNK
ncbi:amino acid permease [Listeria newyorkensis]|uniref:Amino acid permease n=1 Tax=Listeria newyorkensis TaxID=1497681 RepID=A0ABX4XQE4_9LIST|nr:MULTISPECIES: amino acid permease [Listeria]KGL42146.1 amino acid permease [Listeriaceae bacterium FSL A5-0209]KGL38260.1 amino acid permease [Listeria newyorkensis]KMT63319.1 amino acid permease [Listeria newyorkensis]PNP94373.1 amino acid permease [Listeria newyorkensis]RQW67665.1 amino acid permease [Listeria sp. SHR_NRA_18]